MVPENFGFRALRLGCAVAERVLDIVNTPEVLEGVEHRHQLLVEGLLAIAEIYPVFSRVRGSGLLLGAVLSEAWKGQARQIQEAAQQEGLLVLQAGPDVIRLAPSLIIPEEDIREALARLSKALAKLVG